MHENGNQNISDFAHGLSIQTVVSDDTRLRAARLPACTQAAEYTRSITIVVSPQPFFCVLIMQSRN